ncbi:MAG: MFS transporter [Anaerolineales bacterium]|nr:MFS transporter [Anaerolineales bacterium]
MSRLASLPAASRNFWLGVLNGLFFTLAETLIDPTLVLVAFVSRLTDSPVLIGLVAPLRDGAWFLPQFWLSGYVQSLPVKLTLYRRTAVARLITWGALAALTLAAPAPGVMLVGFFIAFGAYAIASGFGGLAFMEVVAKTVPPSRRVVFFAWRLFSGGLAGLGAAALVRWLLSEAAPLAFPGNFSLLFGLGWIAAALGLAAFGLIREPPDVRPRPRVSAGIQLGRAWQALRADASFRRLIYVRSSLLLAGAAVPFFAVYVRTQLGGPPEMVGAYLSVYTVASLFTNVVLGRLAGRLGNRRLLLVGVWASLAMTGLVAALAGAAAGWGVSGPTAAWWLVPAFALAGVRETSVGISGQPLLMEIAPADDRPLYLGFSNTLLGVVLLSTGLSGVVVAALGFETLLGVSLAAGLLAWLAARRLQEPPRPA